MKKSLYRQLGRKIRQETRRRARAERIDIQSAVRRIRREKSLSGVELCERAGDLDPRTLTALEKGRIKNPSIKTLQSVARGLQMTVSDLFRKPELDLERHFYLGSQKGAYHVEFPAMGVKAVSYTPFIHDFFCGKLILAARKRLDQTILKHPLPIFVSTLIGRFEVVIEDRKLNLKEGENLFFNGILHHSFYNPLERESAMLLVTAPSFL